MKQSDRSIVNLFDMGYISNDGQIMTPSGAQMNLNELKIIAQKQQQQIELQQNLLVAKEQKLKFIKQQFHQSKSVSSENDRLKKLRTVVEAQEGKLLKVQALKEKLEQQISQNSVLSHQTDSLQNEYKNKQNAISNVLTKVQELKNHLNELRRRKINNDNDCKDAENNNNYGLNQLRNEVIALNQAHGAHQKGFQEKKEVLNNRREEVADLDRQIEELTGRIEQKKKDFGAGLKNKTVLKSSSTGSLPRMHTIVAAVEPLIKQTNPSISVPPIKGVIANGSLNTTATSQSTSSTNRFRLGKSNQVITRNTFLQKQANVSGSNFGRQRALSSILDNRTSHVTAQENRDFYNKSMPPTTNKEPRPDSAMGRLRSVSTSQNQDSFTAKVRPLVSSANTPQATPKSLPSSYSQQTSQSASYYPLNTKSQSLDSPVMTSPKSNQVFAYKKSPAVRSTQVTGHNSGPTSPPMLPAVSQPPFNTHSPPPYPSSPDKKPSNVDSLKDTDQASENRDSFVENRTYKVDMEALRRKFAHAPRPLKKRSSFTEADRLKNPIVPKVPYDKLYKKADKAFYRSPLELNQRSTPPPPYEDSNQITTSPLNSNQFENQSASFDLPNNTVSHEKNITPKEFMKQQNQSPARFRASKPSVESPPYNQEHKTISDKPSDSPDTARSVSSSSPSRTKGILKLPSSRSRYPGRRIRFDPFALLLDASLEGDFDLVQRIIKQVPNPSQSNDEGITALHNAVCACHFNLVKFLVHYGSDVNAADADGWTPLHCSASCNNLPMSRFLVENGACVFATTLSDGETAADKCEEFDEGFIACSEYLYGIQDKLGVVRQGQVYALYDYTAQNDDELSFEDGDLMTILRRGDNMELKWWWARIDKREGYIPCNLIGVWPRIKSNKDSHD